MTSYKEWMKTEWAEYVQPMLSNSWKSSSTVVQKNKQEDISRRIYDMKMKLIQYISEFLRKNL